MNSGQIQQYLDRQVNPVMERLMVDIIKEKPKSIANFCKVWFERQVEQQKQVNNSDSESDEEELPGNWLEQKKNNLKWYKPRNGICGQVYGNYNKRPEVEFKFIKKKTSVSNRILFHLKSLFLFKDLDDRDITTLINTMQQENYSQKTLIFKEGDPGNAIYIVDEGELDCYKIINNNQLSLKTIKQGQCFGQLSMMYNTPRQANIRVKAKAVLFKLNRNVFTSIVRDEKLKRRKIYCQVLQKVQLFRDLQRQQRYQIEDVLQEMLVHPNQYVIRQGKSGNKFYIVEDGKLVALKKQPNGHQKIVYNYKQGDYFGQLALLHNKPRQASIMALTHTKLLYVEREAFQRVIGPLERILKRTSEVYQKYKEY